MKYSIKTLVLCKTHVHTHVYTQSSMVHIELELDNKFRHHDVKHSVHIRQFWHLSLMPMAQTWTEQNFKVVKCVN